MTDQATCWSLTIFDMNEVDNWKKIPGWKLSGQYEEGKETGKKHFQGMLQTPQVRFSAIKRVFPGAHIEPARDRAALAKYTSKEETRVATYEAAGVPSLFDYQDTIAGLWDVEEFGRRRSDDAYLKRYKYDVGDLALAYVDELVASEIVKGQRGIEFIGINPMWRSSWKNSTLQL